MSYGTPAEVASFVPRFVDQAGVFSNTTRPTLTQVEAWITQVSGILDAYIASKNYDTPVTDADIVSALDLFVTSEVAGMVEGVNGSGRFGPTPANVRPQSQFTIVKNDVIAFIDSILPNKRKAPRSYEVVRVTGLE